MPLVVAQLLARASEWTWRFLDDAPFRPREETVTELILTEFVRNGAGRTAVYKATTGEEATSGLDWAWALQTPAGWLHMLIQAKQIAGSRFGVYPELRKPSAYQQAANLIHAAGMFDALPAYAFYNSEVPPFGGTGSQVHMGACLRAALTRNGMASGYPWNGYSPLGVTLAHAEDVRDAVIPPPAANQRAAWVNRFAMPWECLLCPAWQPSVGLPSDAYDLEHLPRIALAARGTGIQISYADADQAEEWRVSQDGLDLDAEPPAWITETLPAWASAILEGQGPWQLEEAPRVRYFIVSRSQDDQ